MQALNVDLQCSAVSVNAIDEKWFGFNFWDIFCHFPPCIFNSMEMSLTLELLSVSILHTVHSLCVGVSKQKERLGWGEDLTCLGPSTPCISEKILGSLDTLLFSLHIQRGIRWIWTRKRVYGSKIIWICLFECFQVFWTILMFVHISF